MGTSFGGGFKALKFSHNFTFVYFCGFQARKGSNMANKVDYTTLGVTYGCSILALVCIMVRLLCRRIRGERCLAFRDDMWMGISIIPLLLRLGVIHVVLLYGTNSIAGNPAKMARLTPEEITQRILGSQMVIVSRIGHPAL